MLYKTNFLGYLVGHWFFPAFGRTFLTPVLNQPKDPFSAETDADRSLAGKNPTFPLPTEPRAVSDRAIYR